MKNGVVMKYYILAVLLSVPLLVSCSFNGIRGNGNIVNEEREISEFNKINVSGRFDVEAKVGKPVSLIIIAEDNLLQYIKTKVKKNTLIISTRENLRPRKDLIIQITTPELVSIDCSGANDLMIDNVNTDIFAIDLSGAGSIEVNGKAKKFNIDISGAADLEASEFFVEDVNIDISGAASADVYASKSLDAEVSGASSIKLYGNAQDVRTDISGVASFSRAE